MLIALNIILQISFNATKMHVAWKIQGNLVEEIIYNDGVRLLDTELKGFITLHVRHPIRIQSHLTIQRLVTVLSVSLKCPLIHTAV